MEVRQLERALMERDLGHAVDRRHFTLAYQPICDAASLRIQGFEALLRWNHPVRGQVLPGHFVSLAEANGLILPLGDGRWRPPARKRRGGSRRSACPSTSRPCSSASPTSRSRWPASWNRPGCPASGSTSR